jgi:predicted nucleotidyltransferase
MDRPDPIEAARELVAAQFPDARQAWLSGSVVLGRATSTSDLDVTVLLEEAKVRRESLIHRGWPVELFVHTESSIRHFMAKDLARRRPTMARLVSTGVPLIDGPGGARLQQECAAVVEAGPGHPTPEQLALSRYMLTDQLDDLAGGGTAVEQGAVVVEVWRRTAELLLSAAGWWEGAGKWLTRELEALDAARGTQYAKDLHSALRAAISGETTLLVTVAEDVLALAGGRLWAGFEQGADFPAT